MDNRHGLRALAGFYEEILEGAAWAQESSCKCYTLGSQFCFIYIQFSFTRAGVQFVRNANVPSEPSKIAVRDEFPSVALGR